MNNPFVREKIVLKPTRKLSDRTDKEIADYVEELTRHHNWQYLEELLSRKLEKVHDILATAENDIHIRQSQGMIRAYELILKLKK